MTELLEPMNVNIAIKGININLYIVYRPPKGSVIEFCNSLAMILECNLNTDKGKLLMLGDFNIHLDEENNPDTIWSNKLHNLLHSYCQTYPGSGNQQ